MADLTVREIVAEYLSTHGYDGLYSYDCGCPLGDLMCCGGEFVDDCKAGIKLEPTSEEREEWGDTVGEMCFIGPREEAGS